MTLNRSAVKLARSGAKVFADKFPGKLPDETWLTDAAIQANISEKHRDAWMSEVRAEADRLLALWLLID